MLTPAQIDALADELVGGAQERMVNRLFTKLVKSLGSDGDLSAKDLQTFSTVAGWNRDAVNRILLEHKTRISAEVQARVEAALKAADDGDVEILSRIHPEVVMPGASAQFARIAEETAKGVALIIERDNLQMAYHAQQVWIDAATDAITAYNHGAETMDTIMQRAVSRISNEGLTTIDYKSGVRSQIDVAVRRHIVTQTNQAAGRMAMMRLEAFDHDLVQTSAHFGARPEHAVWQGRVFSLTGTGYPDFVGSTDYGSVTGLCGANCRHTFGPYWEGITDLPKLPATIEGMDNETLYDATQKQRGYERAIRATKREIDGLQKVGADATAARLRLGKQQARLRAHINKTGLPRQSKREKAYGIGKVQPLALRKRPAA
jgi:hypothetical protein